MADPVSARLAAPLLRSRAGSGSSRRRLLD